ncbi:MAG: hypothetical protein PHG03_01135 [Bacilli bacterium]|nr:hypothetical protein [Bacilli bacterium]MDD4795150.1 hypothetical protein [Bacilli bacterium]
MNNKTLLKINKYLRIIILVVAVLMCQQVSLMKSEAKTANNNLNKTLDLHAMAIKLDEIIRNDLYAPIDTYNGVLTGYAADCPLCGGTLGCTGQDVLTDRITTHNDETYGTVRIVASSKSLRCGSIVQFALPSVSDEKITAIVLDRGVIGTSLDLLVESEEIAYNNVGRKQISYDILRFGYER